MLQNKVALVTGASSGIGKAIAESFAANGATVGILARRAERLEALAAEIGACGGRAIPLVADLGDEDEIRRAVADLTGATGRLDILVNNAGAGVFGRMPTGAEFDRIFAVNVRSVYQLTLAALPHLQASQGAIINIGSTAVERPFAGELVYMASKGAVAAMTRSMALTWGKSGVRANLIQPGVIPTEFVEMAGIPASVAAEKQRHADSLNALAAQGRPGDVASAALFLASDAARFITGAVLNVDGGFTLGGVPA